MLEIATNQLTQEISALFDAGDPANLRCTGVLQGILPDQIWVDNPANPLWAILREATFGTLYLGSSPDPNALAELTQRFSPTSDVLIGLWPNDPRWSLIPPNAQYDGRVIDLRTYAVGRASAKLGG